jgi:hypothetical protein
MPSRPYRRRRVVMIRPPGQEDCVPCWARIATTKPNQGNQGTEPMTATTASTSPPSTSSSFRKATRARLKLRMAVDGPSGSGKSVTALRFAFALARAEAAKRNDGKPGRIAAINTEHGGLELYTGEVFDGDGPFDFDVRTLTSFPPTAFTSAINDAGRDGYDVVVIDSLSHAWEGKEGALEQVSKSGAKNSYTAWKDVTPQHRAMIDAILQSPCHVICTMRSKTEYVLEDVDGKKVPRKLALAPVQRSGMEYEFDIYGSMDWSHVFTVTKSRCRHVDGAIEVKPGSGWMRPVIEWLNQGAVTAAPETVRLLARAEQVAEIARLAAEANNPISGEKFQRDLIRRFNVAAPGDLTADQADSCLAKMRSDKALKSRNTATTATAATATTATAAATTTPAATATPPVNGTPTAAAPATPSVPAHANPHNYTPAELSELADLRRDLFALTIPLTEPESTRKETWAKVLAKRTNAATGQPCKSAFDLSRKDMSELKQGLRDKIAKLKAAGTAAVGST